VRVDGGALGVVEGAENVRLEQLECDFVVH
jgi:hypothetical protein